MRFQTATKFCCLLPLFVMVSSCSVLEQTGNSNPPPLFAALADQIKQQQQQESKPLFADTKLFGGSSTKSKAKTQSSQTQIYPTAPKTTGTVIRNVRTTAFCHLENEPGAYGNLNAIGTSLRYYSPIRSAAADWSRYPLGTQFKIVGQPHIYEIDDFGSALVGNGTIDFYFPTLEQMNNWGLRYVDIEVIKWGSWSKSISYLSADSRYWHVRQMYHALYAKLN